MCGFDLWLYLILLYVLIMLLCGFYSLLERNMLAIFQMRVGPSLCLFGVCTPITDGVNLIFNFLLCIIAPTAQYLFISMFVIFFLVFIGWFLLPLGFIISGDTVCSIFVLLAMHLCLSVFSYIVIGYYVVSSCYVYLSVVRVLFFSILLEASVLLFYVLLFVIDGNSFYNFNSVLIGQYFQNFIVISVISAMLYLYVVLLDSLNLPFDYLECESELVGGVLTEFSGVFFMFFSLLEISHTLLSSVIVILVLVGGIALSLNSILLLIFFFLYVRSAFCSMRVTHVLFVIYVYIYMVNFSVVIYSVFYNVCAGIF